MIDIQTTDVDKHRTNARQSKTGNLSPGRSIIALCRAAGTEKVSHLSAQWRGRNELPQYTKAMFGNAEDSLASEAFSITHLQKWPE
jgi:hypothetical protein